MAIVFPATPAIGDLYPADPGTSGVTQYIWRGDRWDAVTSMVALGTANQGAYNQYQWPATDAPTPGLQLTSDAAGTLTWEVPAAPTMQILGLLEPFDGVNTAFTFVESGTTTPFTPVPSTNVIVFLGGVPQIPTAAYTTAGNTITFTEAPLVGTTFYAISNVVV